MLMRQELQQKTELVDLLAERAAGLAGERGGEVRRFTQQFYEHVAPDDCLGATPEELLAVVLSLWELGQVRPPGVTKIRLSKPSDAEGRGAAHTIIEIVNDDMPFLVDSVAAELHRQGAEVLLVIHPIVTVERDGEGRMLALRAPGAAVPGETQGALRESYMHIRVNAQLTAGPAELEGGLLKVLGDVRAVVEDFPAMRERCHAVSAELTEKPPPLAPHEIEEGIEFLGWLAARNFTFLGYREYSFEGEGDRAVARVLAETGLGLLRDEPVQVFDGLRNLATLPPEVRDFLRQPVLVRINKTNRSSTVHKPVSMDSVAVKSFDAQGRVSGERLFVGLFTAAAYSASPLSIPILREKIQQVIDRAGFAPNSYDGKNLRHIIETYPRDELFQVTADELYRIALGILHLQERQRVAFFPRRDPFERFISCLVFVPRDHYDTDLRLKLGAILAEVYQGTVTSSQAHITDSVLARIQIVVATKPGSIPEVDPEVVEARLAEAARSWEDRLREALVARYGEAEGVVLTRRYRNAFPASYQDRFAGEDAVFDIARIEEALATDGLALNLYRPPGVSAECLRFKVYGTPPAVPLSDILPMLENMGVKVVDENPYDVRLSESEPPVWIRDFSLMSEDGAPVDLDAVREAFHEAFEHVWRGWMENDGFNKLVLRAGLVAREVTILRAYCKYLRQTQIPFSQTYMEQTLGRNPQIARALVDLFLIRFDPRQEGDRADALHERRADIERFLDFVSNLDEDRILRRFLNLIEVTLRTTFFQNGADGKPKSYLSLKLDSLAIEELPLPRPFREVFVYSPRFEAIHLRGGKVARGGIRWSDRREDFRTEVLGLMKAQMVKNAVIVPVGSKGGFVLKRAPVGREKLQEEGIECYKTMMRGLLDLTDNLKGEEVVPPLDVVRYDDNDPYLVVAADKGTASFSDIANGISAEYGFWLDDAFASGGSAGYDHKEMAITSRGVWESVKRHFRELGKDTQTTDFTVVGVGDMSGDVFGNGMRMSQHIRLLAAFDHRHIFLDPDPDPARSFAERQRLFAKPRSSWADYDPALISAGGGVFARTLKSIPVSAQVKAVLGLAQDEVSPPELMNAILKADVELLFFGGIGTYLKASTESHADASDRANDLIRADASQIRARVVGEGANLGVTQRARVEYALRGGRINTDFIDNSAGVDCSDHEVNIKILLGDVERSTGMTRPERDELLRGMTDEVAGLVLRDNYLQTQALSVTHQLGDHLLDRVARLMRQLEKEGPLKRRLEYLPDEEVLADRARLRQGFTRPELSVLLSYTKMTVYDELLNTDLPDDPYMEEDLKLYFPTPLRQTYAEQIKRHRLHREIIATAVTNSMVNRVGVAFFHEVRDRTGMPPADVARAYVITREVFGLRALWGAIEAQDNKIPAAVQYQMLLECGRATERGTSWFLGQGHGAIDIGALIKTYGVAVRKLHDDLDSLLAETDLQIRAGSARRLSEAGVPPEMALRVASLPWLAPPLCDVVCIADATGVPPEQVGRVYFLIGARFGFDWLRWAAGRISTDKTWNKLAVSAVVDDLFGQQAELTSRVLTATDKGAAPEDSLNRWIEARRPQVARAEQLLTELRTVNEPDLAMLAVANRALKSIGA
jgi:glutamate dehydrogenase